MKFSYFMPNMLEGRFATLGTVTWETMLERAHAAETLGYDGIWVGEFIETPKDVATGFPGEPPNHYAPISTLAGLAVATERVRLTSAVVVLPYHDPLILAREMATLDHISGGRITLGIGLGSEVADWRRTRQQLAKVNRSELIEESVAAMRALWTEPKASFRGAHFAFDEVETFPKPSQRPFPVFMAGKVEAVLERVARSAQGWIEVTFDPDNMRAAAERIERYLAAAGRGGERLEICRQFFMSIGETEEEALSNKNEAIRYQAQSQARKGIVQTRGAAGHEREVLGSTAQVRERMHAYAEAGVTEICLTFYESGTSAAIRQLELFAAEVIPDFR